MTKPFLCRVDLPRGYEDHYPFATGDTVLMLGEIEQMPGHVKPLPVEEVEARAAAFVEMKAILTDISRQYWAFQDAGQGPLQLALGAQHARDAMAIARKGGR